MKKLVRSWHVFEWTIADAIPNSDWFIRFYQWRWLFPLGVWGRFLQASTAAGTAKFWQDQEIIARLDLARAVEDASDWTMKGDDADLEADKTSSCKFCARSIHQDAMVCRHCRRPNAKHLPRLVRLDRALAKHKIPRPKERSDHECAYCLSPVSCFAQVCPRCNRIKPSSVEFVAKLDTRAKALIAELGD